MIRSVVVALALLTASACLASPPPLNGTHEERFASGQVKTKARYKKGALHGGFTQYHSSGAVAVKAKYKAGLLHGKYLEKDAEGRTTLKATYRAGELHGTVQRFEGRRVVSEQVWHQGRLLLPKSIREIKTALAEIEARPSDERFSKAANTALTRLNIHRYVAGLPADVTLDVELADRAAAGARLCQTIGRLDHTPQNPGMNADAFAYAYSGTSSSNLHMGGDGLAGSVDSYMDDSDAKNIDRVGHRRWCLSPQMMKTGFGDAGAFSAMWAFDRSRSEPVDYAFIAYPTQGYMPLSAWGPKIAWSVSFNLQRYSIPDRDAVRVGVYPLGPKEFGKPARRDPLVLDTFNARTTDQLGTTLLIFRPEAIDVAAGKRFWVEIEGVKRLDAQAPPTGYLVEFVGL